MCKKQFLKIPHCPNSKVTLCAIGEAYTDVIKALNKQNVETFIIPKNDKLSDEVSCHADLQLGLLDGNTVVVGKNETQLRNRLEKLGFNVLESFLELENKYPMEAQLDFLALENTIIANSKIIEKMQLLKKSQILHINQGYAKCNIAVVNSKALITSDNSIAKVCQNAGFDVLQIQSGYIDLDGYDTGFIGGCCGLISENCLAVCGDLQTHIDYVKIKNFLNKYNISVLKLFDGNLKDVGGIIPLKQI